MLRAVAWLPYDYWSSYEERVDGAAEFAKCVQHIRTFGEEFGRIYLGDETRRLKFFWRGQPSLVYGLHSSLARALAAQGRLTEPNMVRAEREMLREARNWLDVSTLPALDVLARLQHHGAPTRLLDFTRDPYMALFFAVEKNDDSPGRVIAIGVPEDAASFTRAQTRSRYPAWWEGIADWDHLPRIWEPEEDFPRLSAQEGVFLIAGVPSRDTLRNRRDSSGRWIPMPASEVRECMSVPFNLASYSRAPLASEGSRGAGRPPRPPVGFTLRIEGSKEQMRAYLGRRAPRVTHATVYPDEPGFAAHASSVGGLA
jgi:hypothetical protein